MEPESINRNRGHPHAATAPEAREQLTKREYVSGHIGLSPMILTRKIEKDSCDSNKEKSFQVGATCYSTYKHTRS